MYLYRELAGSGDPLVLLNGIMMSTASWAPQLGALSQRYRCILHDFRGQGRSDKPPGPYAMSMHVADLAALLDELAVERVHVVGTSYGGEVGMLFALAHPERVRSLTVIACVSEAAAVVRGDVASWSEAARSTPEKLFDIVAPAVYSPRFLTPEAMQLGRERLAALPAEWFRALADLCDAFEALDITAELGSIACPTLVVAGADDVLKPPSASETIAARIPGATLVVIPGAAHAVFLEQADAVNRAILEFLAGV